MEVVGGKVNHVDNGVFVLGEKEPLATRLASLMVGLESILDQYEPEAAAVEGIFQHRNARSALILGHARGVALANLARRGISVNEYSPQQVKKAVTGSGRASKEQVQQMVVLRMSLQETPQEDAADAVAVALCHGQNIGLASQGKVELPPKRRGEKRKAAAALEALVMAQQRGRK